MNWVTSIWSMGASACLTLALVYLLVWCKQRTAWANLLFSSAAAATAAMAFCELAMMHAETPGQFGTALRWIHVAAFVVILSLIGFVISHMRAGRPWLAWAVCGVRAISVLLNFVTGPNLNFRELTGLRPIPFFGETIAVGVGVANPWMLVGQLSLLLFVIFVADATITVWRRGDRLGLVLMGASIVFFVLATTVQAVVALWQLVPAPITPSLFYLGIMAMMAFEVSRDVLRAAQLSDDLRESEERLSLALEAAGAGVWVWRTATNQIWGSERWLRLFGFAPDASVTFEQVIQRIHPDDRKTLQREVQQALEGQNEYTADFRLVLPDGSPQWVVARGRGYPATIGKPARIMGVTIDIGDRKRAELALAESEMRYRTLFESAPDGIVLIGLDGCIRTANPAQAHLYGYESPEQLEGFYAPFCVAEKDRERSRKSMQALLEGTEMPVRQYTAVRRDGSEFMVEVTSAILRGINHEVQGYLCLTRDITESEKAELELTQKRNELAHLSRVNMLGELAGSLAHELNQPLTSILSNAQAAQRFLGREPAELNEVRDIMADIVSEDKRAGEIIHRLRLLLKKGEVQHQVLSINEVVQDVLKLVRSDLVNHGVFAQTELTPELPAVLGDRVQLQQVLLNLVMNACDAMAGAAADDRQLTISTRREGDDAVCVSVADRGVGIAAKNLEQVFTPFFTTKSHGMGLGLAVCRTIITSHGGRLWVAGNAERGATFLFTLPVAGEREGGGGARRSGQ